MLAMLTRRSLLLVAALVLVAAPVRADDSKPGTKPATKKMDNPEYAQWAAFKVGAFVEQTTESAQAGMTSTMKMTHKMVELTADKAVIETTIVTGAAGQETTLPASKRDVPKVLELPDIKVPDVKVPEMKTKQGEETIEVAGKKVACKTAETTMETEMPGMGSMKTWSKTWTSKDVPGNIVKMDSKTDTKMGETTINSTSKLTVTKFGTGG